MKRKIILIAYDLNPRKGSECGKADLWLKLLTKFYFVEVYTDSMHQADIRSTHYTDTAFHFIELEGRLPVFLKKLGLYNLVYTLFIKRVKARLKAQFACSANAKDAYSLIHCITPAGLHSYNDLYQLKIPLVIGPLGGGLKIPPGFGQIVKPQRIKYFFRNLYYTLIMKSKKWQLYFKHASKIIIGTHYLKENLPVECHDRVVIIFDTLVDPEVFKPADNNPVKASPAVEAPVNNHSGTNKVITFVGRMDVQKGSEILLAAYCRLIREYPQVSLNFVGKGPLEKLLKEKVGCLGLENKVTLWGKISRPEVKELLNKTDIFCLPTLSEPGGVSILEAMACEVPVITTNYGGPAFSVNETCGIKIEPINLEYYISELKKALLSLLTDEKRRQELGKNGRKRVIEEFSPQALEKKIGSLYDSIFDTSLNAVN